MRFGTLRTKLTTAHRRASATATPMSSTTAAASGASKALFCQVTVTVSGWFASQTAPKEASVRRPMKTSARHMVEKAPLARRGVERRQCLIGKGAGRLLGGGAGLELAAEFLGRAPRGLRQRVPGRGGVGEGAAGERVLDARDKARHRLRGRIAERPHGDDPLRHT